jgi:Fanconi anemia group M protein
VKTLTLIVDSYSANVTVTRLLKEKGIATVETSMKSGQYMITDSCVIWHMTSAELARLTADKSIFRRVLEFKRSVPEPVVLVEGDPLAHSDLVSVNALRGALSFIAMHNRVPILTAANTNDVAEMIYIMTNQAQNGMGLTLTEPVAAESTVPAEPTEKARGDNGSIPKEPAELQEYMVRAIPEVGPVIAKAMIKKYGTLRAVFSASVKDLIQVEGIGPKKAKKIAEFLDGKFEK